MKILAFSDLHLARAQAVEIVAASAEADLVIGAGDFCNMREGLDLAMDMLRGIDKPFVVVPGNAESSSELSDAAPPNMINIHGKSCDVAGLTFFGLGGGVPITPFGDWSFDIGEEMAASYLDACDEADIMVFHSPPKGIADRTSNGLSIGSTAIRAAIERVQPRLAVCGHVHDCWGETGIIGATQVVNLGPRPNWFELN